MTLGETTGDWLEDYRDSVLDATEQLGVQRASSETELWGGVAGAIHDAERRAHRYEDEHFGVRPEHRPQTHTKDFRNASPRLLQSKYNWYLETRIAPIDNHRLMTQ